MSTPSVTNVKRHAGIAGQYEISATVQYDGESAETIRFVGSTYGGPIVMVTPAGQQVFVSESVLARCGHELSPEWVARFFADQES